MLLHFVLQSYYEPLQKAGTVISWKLYFEVVSHRNESPRGSFGLMTVLRRAITLAGVKPVGAYQHRFIHRYCFAVVEPLQGDHCVGSPILCHSPTSQYPLL